MSGGGARIRSPDWSANCRCTGPGTHGIDHHAQWLCRSSTSGVPGHHILLSDCPTNMLARGLRPHRLVVRTSRCGRDNPGSTPGVVMQVRCRDTRHGLLCQMTGFDVLVWSRIRIPDWSANCRCSGPGTHGIDIVPSGSGGLQLSGAPWHQSLSQ